MRPPRVVIAPDSFKESLSAPEVAAAIGVGLARVWPDAELVELPVADGGEGTVAAMVEATGGRLVALDVRGPDGRTVHAAYGLLGDGRTAVVEAASAAGLHLVAQTDRDPGRATTYGVGQLVADALDHEVQRVVVGLGGTATNDGGAGLLEALGARLLDADDEPVERGGAALQHVRRLDLTQLDARLGRVEVEAACDVDNPLLGPEGATAVFGPQKGVLAEQVPALDGALHRWADLLAAETGRDLRSEPGAGAAGGLGFALISAASARLRPGFELVAEAVDLRRAVAGADLVITGEGRVDAQTVRGKAPSGVIGLAREAGVPVVVVGGSVGPGSDQVVEAGAVAVFGCVPAPASLEDVLEEARANLERTAQQIAATWESGRRAAAVFERSNGQVG